MTDWLSQWIAENQYQELMISKSNFEHCPLKAIKHNKLFSCGEGTINNQAT